MRFEPGQTVEVIDDDFIKCFGIKPDDLFTVKKICGGHSVCESWRTEEEWCFPLHVLAQFPDSKFKVGDRVLVDRDISDSFPTGGKYATVVHVDYYRLPVYGLEFDDDVNGHTCCMRAKQGHGLYVLEDRMFKVPKNYRPGKAKIIECPDMKRHNKALVIEKVLLVGPETVLWYTIPSAGRQGKVVATCHPDDTYDEHVGIQVATLKAYEEAILETTTILETIKSII